MTLSTLPKVVALSSLVLMMLFNLGAVFTCDAPINANPMAIGMAGSELIAVYNVSNTFCLFQVPSSHVTGGKVYLSGGKDLKVVAPDVSLPTVVFGSAVISDTKGGRYIMFYKEQRHGPRSLIRKLVSRTLGDDGRGTLYDIDNKKKVDKGVEVRPDAISSKDPMTIYSVDLDSKAGFLFKSKYKGESLPGSDFDVGTSYRLCADDNDPQKLTATQVDDRKDCNKPLPYTSNNIGGFSDDSNFYIILNGSKVLSFGKDAIGDKAGQPVPYTLSPLSSTVVPGDPPGGDGSDNPNGGRDKTKENSFPWVAVIIIVILFLCIIPCVICCICVLKNKKKDDKKGGKSGKGKTSKSASKGNLKGKGKKDNLSKCPSGKKGRSKSGLKTRSKRRASQKSSRMASSSRGKRSLPVGVSQTSRKASSKKMVSGKVSFAKVSAKSSKKSIKR